MTEFMILTGARPGEVTHARKGQRELKYWVKEIQDTKQRRIHNVPLSVRALAIWDLGAAMHPDSPQLFPGMLGKIRSTDSITKFVPPVGAHRRPAWLPGLANHIGTGTD